MLMTRFVLANRLAGCIIAGILIGSCPAAQGAGRTIPERTKAFTIDDIFVAGKFNTKGIRGFQWIDNGKAYSYLETDTALKQTNLWRYDVASGKKTELVDARNLVVKEGEQPFSIQ